MALPFIGTVSDRTTPMLVDARSPRDLSASSSPLYTETKFTDHAPPLQQMDGVASITQCPLAPGDSQTYKWRATQYGSTWYHSHFSVQAWDGVFGGIVINGPATANYDVDLGHVFLNDWSSQTAPQLAEIASTSGPPVCLAAELFTYALELQY